MELDINLIPLLPGEKLVDAVAVPFEASVGLGMDLLVDVMTEAGTKMPLASRAFDESLGEGLFEAEFGRDALTMAAFVATELPKVTALTVTRLAVLQGVTDKSQGGLVSDAEEVGRIPHEARDGGDPIAVEYTAKFGWDWPYYGSVDATPLFISAALRAAKTNPELMTDQIVQRDGVVRTIGETVSRAASWLTGRLATSTSGLLESTAASNGCWQVWADSFDAYHHSNGSLAKGSVAAIEVQGFAFDALLDAAELAGLGLIDNDPAELVRFASNLRRNVLRLAWLNSGAGGAGGGYLAAGVEVNNGVVEALAVRTANMGLILQSRLLDEKRYRPMVEAIVTQLTDDNGLWSKNGIRTLAAGETRFRAQAYHNGSIWPWQNLWIAKGLHRHGFHDIAITIEDKMLRVINELGCAPEFIDGSDTDTPTMVEAIVVARTPDGNGGIFEHKLMQPAQHHQGWTVFGIYALTAVREQMITEASTA